MTHSENELALQDLRLHGMAQCYREQISGPTYREMSLSDLVGKMCIAQRDANRHKRVSNMLKRAKLRISAQPEDIIWERKRGLDKQKHSELLNPDWVRRKENLLLTGCSGTGKTWLACALGQSLIRQTTSVLYRRTKLLLDDVRIAKLDGSLSRLRKSLTRPELLILDDFGIAPIDQTAKEDLFELIESRSGEGSILIAGQLSPKEWHGYLASDHLADAIMDRLIQNSHTIELKGDSLRSRLS